jgi:hypothetical protein
VDRDRLKSDFHELWEPTAGEQKGKATSFCAAKGHGFSLYESERATARGREPEERAVPSPKLEGSIENHPLNKSFREIGKAQVIPWQS